MTTIRTAQFTARLTNRVFHIVHTTSLTQDALFLPNHSTVPYP